MEESVITEPGWSDALQSVYSEKDDQRKNKGENYMCDFH